MSVITSRSSSGFAILVAAVARAMVRGAGRILTAMKNRRQVASLLEADPAMLRRAIGAAKIALCLVRRANRDGHSMRTFEVPAVGACPLLEDTEEHRELFGEEGQAAIYFSTIHEMVAKAKWLLEHDTERQQITDAAHRLITGGQHTYKDRLCQMLSLPG